MIVGRVFPWQVEQFTPSEWESLMRAVTKMGEDVGW